MTMHDATTIRSRTVPIVLGAVVVSLIAATLMLWAHYGTAIFLEMIRNGIASCFG